jgi:hypothetical protein
MEMRALLHQASDQIVGDPVHEHFAFDHLRVPATQHVHRQQGLDLVEVQFDPPTPPVEAADLVGGIGFRVEQRRHHHRLPGAEPFGFDVDLDHPQFQRIGQRGELLLAPRAGALRGFTPGHQSVLHPQRLARPEVRLAHLVESQDAVDPLAPQRRHRGVGTEPPVAEHNITPAQLRPQLPEQKTLVDVPASGRPIKHRSAGKGKQAHQLHHGKSAPGLLPAGLRPHRLVFGSVGHAQAGAVDDLHVPSLKPAFLPRRIRFETPGKVSGNELEGVGIEPRPCLAVGAARIAHSSAPAFPVLPPRINPADDLGTGGARTQDLGRERPEGHPSAENTLTAVGSLVRRLEQFVGKQVAKGAVEFLDRADPFDLRHRLTRRTSEEKWSKCLKKRSRTRHPPFYPIPPEHAMQKHPKPALS